MNQWNLPTSSSKSALKPSAFKLFMWNRALPTVSCTFCLANSTMPKKNAPNVRIGLRLLCEIELSLQSCAHFAGLIFQKCSKHVIFLRFLCETELSTVSCTFCQPHLPKVFRTCQFVFRFFCETELSTVSCTFCQPHLPKVFRTCQFVFRFFCETELSLQSRAHFADLIFQKCSERDSFSTYSSANRALATALCTFCWSRPTTAETETLLRRTATLPEKNTGFRARAFSSLNSRVPDLLHFPTTWWWCGWHDDAVAWWWECCPWQSSVTRKFSN